MVAVVHAVVREKNKGIKFDKIDNKGRFSCAFGSYFRVRSSYKTT